MFVKHKTFSGFGVETAIDPYTAALSPLIKMAGDIYTKKLDVKAEKSKIKLEETRTKTEEAKARLASAYAKAEETMLNIKTKASDIPLIPKGLSK